MHLAVGQVLQNRYRIVAPLGQGGMGAVYRAWDLRLGKPVALKEMVPQPGLDDSTLSQLRWQFQQEAMVLAKLKHRYLVLVTDYFVEQGHDYLVMDFVQGEALAERIKREGALPEDQVVVWAKQLLDALAYCHGKGVIHRDIKPQNVVITSEGSAVLVDFGLVKLWDPTDPNTRTVMRGAGTPEYAPPEQWGEQGYHTDPRSDLYSLGATLYHALTGQAPPTASYRMMYPERYQKPRERNERISTTVDAAVSRAMTLAIGDRWPDARAMAQGLETAAKPARTTGMPVPGVARARRARRGAVPVWGWTIGGIVAVALATMGIRALTKTHSVVQPLATSEIGSTVTAAAVDVPTLAIQPTAPHTAPPTAGRTVQAIASQTAAPVSHSVGDTVTRSKDGMVMVYVPAGMFYMGSTHGDDDEEPVHSVALNAFWIDRTEVTNAQYSAFLNEGGNQTEGGVAWLGTDGGYVLIESSGGTYRPKGGYDDHPAIGVSWYGAVAYCAQAGCRLPTEAEWEYAARGPESRVYPWGSHELKGLANCAESDCQDGFETTAPVGSFPEGAGWVGAFDMAGNVWEWVQDLYLDSYYSISPARNPLASAVGEYRVLRGGSWGNPWYSLRTTYRRNGQLPDEQLYGIGFRCAAEAPIR